MKVVTSTTDVQDSILVNLLTTSYPLRYSEIKPESINNDLYNYHLKELVKKGLIDKEDLHYELSHKGRLYVESIKPLRRWGSSANQFKTYSLGIVFEQGSNNSKIWNRVRNRHPFYGDTGISGASVREGETTKTALIRRLKLQTALDVSEESLRHVLTIRKINLCPDGDLFSDIIYFIYIVNLYEGTLSDESEYGQNLWVSIEDAIKNESNSKTQLTGLIELLKTIKDKNISTISSKFCEETQVIEEF